MMFFGRRREICQLLIAVLLCMPALAGQSTSSPSIMKTVSSNASNASNETTSSSKVGYIYSSYFNVQEPSSLIRNYVFFPLLTRWRLFVLAEKIEVRNQNEMCIRFTGNYETFISYNIILTDMVFP